MAVPLEEWDEMDVKLNAMMKECFGKFPLYRDVRPLTLADFNCAGCPGMTPCKKATDRALKERKL